MKTYIKAGLAVFLLITFGLFAVSKETAPPFVEMEVKGVKMDVMEQSPVVVLADKEGKQALPIWIGLPEANAIERELKSVMTFRPMTHDLLHSILEQFHARVKEVKIVDLKDHTYYAKLFLIVNKELIELDARPSDAIVMALKSKAPVFVAAKIVEEQGVLLTKKETLGERHGIRVQELTPSLASHFSFKGEKGVLVSEVVSGSVSEASGMKAGDIITKVNLKEVGTVQEFEDALDAVQKGSPLRISFFRDDKFQEVNLDLRK
jgi:bifunctional DNase/RNase